MVRISLLDVLLVIGVFWAAVAVTFISREIVWSRNKPSILAEIKASIAAGKPEEALERSKRFKSKDEVKALRGQAFLLQKIQREALEAQRKAAKTKERNERRQKRNEE